MVPSKTLQGLHRESSEHPQLFMASPEIENLFLRPHDYNQQLGARAYLTAEHSTSW